jgi:hypothetical protein
MSSTAVGQDATSSPRAHTPTPVQERRKLWAEGSVSIKIPEIAKWAFFRNEEVDVDFLQFGRTIKGGTINMYVHDARNEMIGKTITAKAELWQKTLIDGRSFFYIDLHPSQDAKPTHRLIVMDGATDIQGAFMTPSPMKGYVLFVDPDAKLAAEVPKTLTPAAPTKPNWTGDGQLDRLLAAGWKIKIATDDRVFLTKPGKKDLIHHRPRKR